MDEKVSISYSYDIIEKKELKELKLLHETYIEGQALKFKTACSYINNRG